jgi:acetyl esterase/lipase
MNRLPLLAAGFLVGCGGDSDCAKKASAPSGADAVALLTEDGLCLVADHYRASAGAPAVVFLHMSPLSWDRKSWSVEFLREVTAKGWTVLNLDRRGAGDSEGGAEDAFQGDGGAKDVRAAFDYLADQDVGPIGIVSASNGTTSAVDYTMLASSQGLVEPVSVVMMSPGTYTENQNDIEDYARQDTPTLFQYDPAEGLWIEPELTDLDPGSWEVQSYDGAGHGSQMLDDTPSVATDAIDFLDDNWPTFP